MCKCLTLGSEQAKCLFPFFQAAHSELDGPESFPVRVEKWLDAEVVSRSDTPEWSAFTQKADDFIAKHGTKQRIVCITSGGTMAPLELNTVRFIDNFRLAQI